MSPRELLTAVRTAQGWPSNYRLGRELGIPDHNLQRWNTGAHAPDDATAARLADLAGLDPDAVVAYMQAHRAKEPAERARWQRIAQRLQSVAAALLVGILSGFIGGGPDAGAQVRTPAPVTSNAGGLCITSTQRRAIGRLRRWLEAAASTVLGINPAAA